LNYFFFLFVEVMIEMLKLKYPHAGVFSVCRLGRDEWNKCRGKHSGFSIGVDD